MIFIGSLLLVGVAGKVVDSYMFFVHIMPHKHEIGGQIAFGFCAYDASIFTFQFRCVHMFIAKTSEFENTSFLFQACTNALLLQVLDLLK
jgi:hypothetical protein